MSTMTGNRRRAILSGLIGAALAISAVGMAQADVASDKPGAVLIFPKIVVDTSGLLGPQTDTEIQITNTSNSVVSARCWLVDATSYCGFSNGSIDPQNIPCTPEGEATARRCPTGEVCTPGWNEVDFQMTLTKRQPVSWKASEGRATFPCDGISGFCPSGQSNMNSAGHGGSSWAPPAGEIFFGELKCVEVDPTSFKEVPGFDPANSGAGDLKGEATMVSVGASGAVDARKYNAIGIQATANPNNGDGTLVLGGDLATAEYNGCPNVLLMNHMFDDATVFTHARASSATVSTHLTVIPCGEDFRTRTTPPTGTVLQFLVYNEFEQRFSTSTNFTCFREVPLSDIDTRPGAVGNMQSIFNVGVEGTLSGQTRIRSVEGATTGNTILAVTEEFWSSSNCPGGRCSTATNMHFSGSRTKADLLILSPE